MLYPAVLYLCSIKRHIPRFLTVFFNPKKRVYACLASVFLLLPPGLVISTGLLRAEERSGEWLITREFVSRSGAYRLETAQNNFSGVGGARLRFKDKAGKLLSEFRILRPPLFVSVLDSGLRLVVFYSGGGLTPNPNFLEFYDAMTGRLINSRQVAITGPTWEKLSDDHKLYSLGYNSSAAGELRLFNPRTGAQLRQIKFHDKLNGLMMSGDGKWFIAVFAPGPGRWRTALLDATGGEVWAEEKNTENSRSPVSIAADGSNFEIRERRMIYSGETGLFQPKLMNLTRYGNSGGKVELLKNEEPGSGASSQKHQPVKE